MSHIKRVFFQAVTAIAHGASVRDAVSPRLFALISEPEPAPLTITTTIVAGHGCIPQGAQVLAVHAYYRGQRVTVERTQRAMFYFNGHYHTRVDAIIRGQHHLEAFPVPVSELRSVTALVSVTRS